MSDLSSPGVIRDVVVTLLDNGYLIVDLVEMTGCVASTISQIKHNPKRMLTSEMRERLWSGLSQVVPPPVPEGGELWPRADDVQVHLKDLIAHGFTLRHLAFRLNVSQHEVNKYVIFGHMTRINPILRAMIFEINILRAPAPTPLGARRRIQALVAWGHDTFYIARQLGESATIVENLMEEKCVITQELGEKISTTFDHMEQQPGRCDFSKQLGKENKWPIPFQWDEYSIDELEAEIVPARSPRERPKLYTKESRQDILNREFNELIAMVS